MSTRRVRRDDGRVVVLHVTEGTIEQREPPPRWHEPVEPIEPAEQLAAALRYLRRRYGGEP